MKFDVVIAGAGVSGVPAAVAAAREGAKTLLLEKNSRLGGTMTNSLGFPLCGLFETDVFPPRVLNSGLCADLFSAIAQEVPEPVSQMGRVAVCRCSVERFESMYTRWVEAEDITFLFGVQDLGVSLQKDRIESVTFRLANGKEQTCFADQFIDCTGNGTLIERSGAERILPDRLPLSGFSVRISGVERDDFLPVRVPYVLRKAVEAGTLPAHCAWVVFSPEAPDSALCKFSMPAQTSLAEAEETARSALNVLRERIPALHSAKWVESSPAILHREGARLKGDVVLSGEDVRSGRRVEDAAARGAWPIEYWDAKEGVRYEYVGNQGSYDISLRSLRSKNIRNLWAAGRLLSADSEALASARVMGVAIATGEAAGRAAARATV